MAFSCLKYKLVYSCILAISFDEVQLYNYIFDYKKMIYFEPFFPLSIVLIMKIRNLRVL